MSQGSRSTRSRPPIKQPQGLRVALRILILCIVLAVLSISGAWLIRTISQGGTGGSVSIPAPQNPALNPFEAAGLALYMMLNNDRLDETAGLSTEPVTFIVEAGATAADVADDLVAQGLVVDTTLFTNYLRFYGLDVQIEAGSYQLTQAMTVVEIAQTLTDAVDPEIAIRITEGWRREQIADWIDQQEALPFTGAEFLAATQAGAPLPPDLTYPTDIPAGATLEGFLFPDTYRLPLEATATDLVWRMLMNFDSKVTAQMRADAAARGLSIYDVLTLAAIVEREAAVADERPAIAGVYLNRLAAGMKLEADPTVQYAMGYQAASGEWWYRGLTQADYTLVDSPYNTYLYPGLPPGPIANPGLDAILAVIYPMDNPYLFFRAACDGSGRHNFAMTFEEHLANACP
jgi:UPF0755 protein